eukprot:982112-Rhodomonas_salina.1
MLHNLARKGINEVLPKAIFSQKHPGGESLPSDGFWRHISKTHAEKRSAAALWRLHSACRRGSAKAPYTPFPHAVSGNSPNT